MDEKKKTEELMEENRERAEKGTSEAEEMTVKSYKQIAKKLEGMFCEQIGADSFRDAAG